MSLAASVVLVACSLDVQGPVQTPWDGELSPTGASPQLDGNVAAISRERSTEIGIEVRGGEPGDRWSWRLRTGTCDEPGDVVGSSSAYPVLEAEDESDPDLPGETVVATAETVLSGTLSASDSYHATVAPEDDPETILACGALTR